MEPINSVSENPESVFQISDTPMPTTPTPPKKESNAITIISMAVFVILALGAVAFLYYQNQKLKGMLASYQTSIASPTPTATTDPTANWKTYKSKEFNFNFQYPSELSFIYDGVPGKDEGKPFVLFHVNVQNFDGTKSKAKSNSDFQFSLDVERDRYKTLDEYIPSNISQSSKSKIIIDNNEAIKVVDDAYANWPTIWTRSGSYVYIIQMSNSGKENEKYFDQILSTFKFLDTTSTTAPKPISELFDSINKNFGTNIKPTAEDQFYSPSGPITKQSWKIDLLNAGIDNKQLALFINSNLSPNEAESGGIGGGGIIGYQSDTIKCFHNFMSQGPDIHNYFSCALK